MKTFLITILSTFCLVQVSFASDTTSVRIFFGLNKHSLAKGEKEILASILPNDTSIVLKRIWIYGYRDTTERNNEKHELSLKRANEVKHFLLQKGLDKSLISTVEGKGVKNVEEGLPVQENRIVYVLIEYEAKLIEQTIIIKNIPRKALK